MLLGLRRPMAAPCRLHAVVRPLVARDCWPLEKPAWGRGERSNGRRGSWDHRRQCRESIPDSAPGGLLWGPEATLRSKQEPALVGPVRSCANSKYSPLSERPRMRTDTSSTEPNDLSRRHASSRSWVSAIDGCGVRSPALLCLLLLNQPLEHIPTTMPADRGGLVYPGSTVRALLSVGGNQV
jgi:hypothetical protein